ncbi:MAG: HAMP domain-containing sensor histidine kinase [Actinomycetota bacterium]|nr:HAMP domain-containing sensor histidine kinase [Actinomycetota bacterium]
MRLRSVSLQRRAQQVAAAAALLVLVVYVVVCGIVDVLAHERALHNVDARLEASLVQLRSSFRALGPNGTNLVPVADGDRDVDDAPVLAWWVPTHARVAVALTSSTPPLPRANWDVRALGTRQINGAALRVEGTSLPGGAVIVASSTKPDQRVLDALLLAEGVVAPFLLVGVYLAALLVGRFAAGPVERARQRQLAFAADASHELRTPLSVIEAEVGLALSSHRDAAAYRAALERVAGEGHRLRGIVEDLLFLARFDAEPEDREREAVSLAEIAAEGVDRFGAIAAGKRQNVSFRAEGFDPDRDDGPLVEVEGLWLERLASVLLDNACRYTPEGGVIEVRVATEGHRGLLAVDDSGPGIPEALREEIFERFRRGDAAPSAFGQASGAGLGLAIADAIVGSSGGEFSVGEAALGGASMQVRWPVVRPAGR